MKLMKSKTLLKLSTCMILLFGATCLKAEFWNRPFSGPGQKIDTLVVTGNYAKPRIIAELIQADTRQPILLTPADGQDSIYFMPPQKDGGKAMKIPENELTNFINFLGVDQILVLGNSKYVPEKYFDKISKEQTISRITSKNWQRIANTVGKYLNIPNLPGDYKTLSQKMTSNVNYIRSEDSSPAAEEIQPADDLTGLTSITPDEATTVTDNKVPENEPFIIDASQK
jgi:hypothetical protein